MFNAINSLEKTLNQLKEMEKAVIKKKYCNVMKELLSEVEEFEECHTYDKWFQNECAYTNTHKDPIQKALWAIGNQHTKWMCVEKGTPYDVFYYLPNGGGVGCCDSRHKQLVSVC